MDKRPVTQSVTPEVPSMASQPPDMSEAILGQLATSQPASCPQKHEPTLVSSGKPGPVIRTTELACRIMSNDKCL